MNARRHLPVVCLRALAIVLAMFASVAQAQSKDDPSVTLTVAPQRVQTGGSVRISGVGYPQPGVAANVVITPPGDPKNPATVAAQTTLDLNPDSDGNFSTVFAKTAAAGTYTVTARMGARGNPASAQFAVRPLGDMLQNIPKTEKKLTTDIARLIDASRGTIANLPDSPARTQVLQKLDKLQAQARQLPDQADRIGAALQPLRDLPAREPETAQYLDPLFDKLNGWNAQAQKADDEINRQIARSKGRLASCDRLDQTIEALKAVSAALNFAADLPNIIVNFRNDFIASQAPKALPAAQAHDSNAQFAVSETTKFLNTATTAVSGPIGMFAIAAGLVTDAITQAEQNTFDKYCQKFEGPFTARMEAKFYAAGHINDPWWTYTIDIAGKLVLRYPKDAAGKAVALTGQFEGGATKFTYHEEVWKNSDLFKLLAGGAAIKRDTAPIASPHLDFEGSVFGAYSSPTSFYIPVSGRFANGRIAFKLQDARSDFIPAYTQGHTFYVVISLYTMRPALGHFTLPYKDAHWVLDHYTFDYPVTQTATSMFIQKHDEQSRPTIGTKAYYTLDLKACNPGCG